MNTATSLTLRGPLKIDGNPLCCPGREGAPAPRRLTLLVSGSTVMASCGEQHRATVTGGRRAKRAKCFFAVEQLTPGAVRALAQQVKPGTSFRITLPGGMVIEGKRGPAAAAPAGGQPGSAAAVFAAKKAAARQTGRGTGGTAGAVTAAFQAVTAVAGTAAAAANAVGAGANTVGKGFDMGREGLRTGRAAIRAADNAGARRFARENKDDEQGGDTR
ncbi:hypothetical protein [Streptomyces rubradiris]|uniref:Uncharacterized protein n=1 Tax=Streptomyces rubradiris TaxID=285531 RepID=A0ABQ3RAF4_STRRR|nr:hypothetical protein [Streptomyces rubradiris]GHH26112.1 hypothetical protein GCM10018792_66190 [Streptomyces rubradiris]GHI52824.1 hypothetical protein Srubr_26700 [Streptomyces rubradiris]